MTPVGRAVRSGACQTSIRRSSLHPAARPSTSWLSARSIACARCWGSGHRVEWTGRTETYGRTLHIALRHGRDVGAVLLAEGLAQPWPNQGNVWCAKGATNGWRGGQRRFGTGSGRHGETTDVARRLHRANVRTSARRCGNATSCFGPVTAVGRRQCSRRDVGIAEEADANDCWHHPLQLVFTKSAVR